MEVQLQSKKYISELNRVALPPESISKLPDAQVPVGLQGGLRQMRKIAESGNLLGFQKQFQQFQAWAQSRGFDLNQDIETRVALKQMELTLLMTAAKRAFGQEKILEQKGTEAEVEGNEGNAVEYYQKAKRFGQMAHSLLAEIKGKLG